ncbi:hypothetical protein PAMP_021245 [Pampus punctatissimus]
MNQLLRCSPRPSLFACDNLSQTHICKFRHDYDGQVSAAGCRKLLNLEDKAVEKKESTLRVGSGLEKTNCGLNKDRQRELMCKPCVI